VIVVDAVVLELLASNMTRKLAGDHQLSCSSQSSERRFHGLVVGRWRWRTRLADAGLQRRQCMITA
jgi:hypothetical protein